MYRPPATCRISQLIAANTTPGTRSRDGHSAAVSSLNEARNSAKFKQQRDDDPDHLEYRTAEPSGDEAGRNGRDEKQAAEQNQQHQPAQP